MTPTDRDQRIVMLAQMFATYAQSADENRMRGYLDILSPIPTPTLAESIRHAMAHSGAFPPGPGEIVASWKEVRSSRPVERPYRAPDSRTDPAALNPGSVIAQIEARVAPGDESDVLTLAAELRRTHAKNFPRNPTEQRTPSLVAAAIRLGRHWPMQPDHFEQVTAWMDAAEDEGQATGWWRTERRAAVTAWRGSYIAGALA